MYSHTRMPALGDGAASEKRHPAICSGSGAVLLPLPLMLMPLLPAAARLAGSAARGTQQKRDVLAGRRRSGMQELASAPSS